MADVEYTQVTQNHYFDLKMSPHRYYLELVIGDREKVVDVVEMPLVQGINASIPHALEATETINSHYDESEGFRVRIFTVVGKSGYTTVHLQRYHKYINFIETYGRLMAENKNAFTRGIDYRLVLNFPWEGESYYCNVIGRPYERQRSKQSLSLDWGVTLRTYGFATRKWAQPTKVRDYLSEMCGPDDDQCHIGPQHPCRYNAFKATLEDLPAGWENTVAPQMDKVFGLCDELSEYEKRRPREWSKWNNLYGEAATTYESIQSIAYYSNLVDTYRPVLIDILGWLSNVMMECILVAASNGKRLPFTIANYATNGLAGEVYNSAMSIWESVEGIGRMGYESVWGSHNEQPGDGSISGDSTPARVPVIEASVGDGDSTVYDTADRVVGLRSLGLAIMYLMGMQDARTWRDGTPIKSGDIVQIPDQSGLPTVEGTSLYGEDWLVQKGDFVMNDEGDDFIRVSGVECFIQNLQHRLLTIKSEIRLKPDVGLFDLDSLMDPNLNVGRLMSDVKGQLFADHRTAAISKMSYVDGPGYGAVDVVVQAMTSSRVKFTVSLPQD